MRETQADRDNELLAINEVCKKWRCQVFKLPTFHTLDHALIRGRQVFAIGEVKVRSSSWRKYSRVMVGLEKVMIARQIGRNSGLKTFLFVRWTDGLGFINFEADMTVEIGGRTDRGGDESSLVAMFDINDFIFIRKEDDGKEARRSKNFAGPPQ